MAELHARGSKQGNHSATGTDAGAAPKGGGSRPAAGAGRRMQEGGTSSHEAIEQGQHPNRVDGSENPESGDALLENHESGVWNQEREAQEGGGNGLDDRDEKVRSGAGVSQNGAESGQSSDGDGMAEDGGRSGRKVAK